MFLINEAKRGGAGLALEREKEKDRVGWCFFFGLFVCLFVCLFVDVGLSFFAWLISWLAGWLELWFFLSPKATLEEDGCTEREKERGFWNRMDGERASETFRR